MANQAVLPSSPTLSVRTGDLCARVRSFGVQLTLVPLPNGRGVVLEGLSATFYGKQMAQELARQARFVVVSNRIQVDPVATELSAYSED